MKVLTLARLLMALSSALLLAVGLVGVAAAAPKEDNKRADIIPVSCERLGDFDVTTIDNAATAFGPDGEVLVALRIEGMSEVTFAVEDGPTWTEMEEFDEGGQGKGYQGRLIACSFTEEFHEEFTLDEDTVEFLGLDPVFIGSTISIDGTAEGTAWVLAPGVD